MITAALPLYNCPQAAPIQLESLCEQISAPEWELIVCEDHSPNVFGREAVARYADRLKAANCVKILYVALNKWTPLSEKWLIMSEYMADDSAGFMLCGSDDYSPSTRIQDAHDAMVSGFDWVHYSKGYFYNVLTGDAAEYNRAGAQTGLLQCVAAENMRAIKMGAGELYPRKGVDAWLRRKVNAQAPAVLVGPTGVHTDGVNTLSLTRRILYTRGATRGFFKPADPETVFNLMSEPVRNYIKTLRQ